MIVMKKPVPSDFCRIGHMRPSAFVREDYKTHIYVKECRLSKADIAEFIKWLYSAMDWLEGDVAPIAPTPTPSLQSTSEPKAKPSRSQKQAQV